MCFVAPEQKLFYGNFLSADSVESVYNLGLNFAKFLLPPGLVYNLFCGFRAENVLRPIVCYLTPSSPYWNQGLKFANVFTPWSCLLCVLWLQSRSCFTAIFVTWLRRKCIGSRGLMSLNFSRLGLVYYVFCGSRVEVVLRTIFVTWLFEPILEPAV